MGKRSHVWADPNEHVVVHRRYGRGGNSGSGDDAPTIVLIVIGLIFLGFLICYFRHIFEWVLALCFIGLILGGKNKK